RAIRAPGPRARCFCRESGTFNVSRTLRIMIADDEPASPLLLEALGKEFEFQVVVATDGTAAWHALDRPDAPPIAVLDWQMPGMSGPEICRRVHARPQSVAPYIVLLTVRDKPEDVRDGLASGANDYVKKPFGRDE